MSYNKLVECYFFNPEHVGMLDINQPEVLHHRGGIPGMGDVYDLYLCFDKTGLIKAARFKAFGNPYLIASLELVCQILEGSTLDDHPKFDHSWLVSELEIPKTRYAVALQVEDGYQDLIKQLKLMR